MEGISISISLKVIKLAEVVDGKLQNGILVRMVVRHVRPAVLVPVVLVRSTFAVTLELAEVSTRSSVSGSSTIIALRCVVIEPILRGIAITLGKVSIGSEPDEGERGMVATAEKGNLAIIAGSIYFLVATFGMLLDSRTMVVPFVCVLGMGD